MRSTRAQTGRHNNIPDSASYRVPRQVSKIRIYAKDNCYPVCPRCNMCIDREYVNFCDRCGQRLNWKLFRHWEIFGAE